MRVLEYLKSPVARSTGSRASLVVIVLLIFFSVFVRIAVRSTGEKMLFVISEGRIGRGAGFGVGENEPDMQPTILIHLRE